MRTFDYRNLPRGLFDREVGDLSAQLFEDRGRLEALKDVGAVQLGPFSQRSHADSVEASTRIEGIYLERARIKELVAGADPKTDEEQQVVGYSHALEMIESQAEELELSTSTVVKLYETLYEGRDLGRKSRYRRSDYLYTQVDGHMQAVPVSPVPAFETPLVLGGACDSLAEAFDSHRCSPLALAAVFTVDFLCIRPFEQGNGRIARLFADLLLAKAGFEVARYVSIDRIIEKRAMDYYDSLNACVEGWDVGRATYEPFALFWFEAIHEAYQELFERTELNMTAQGGKAQRVRLFVERAQGAVSKAAVLEACPDISTSTVENELGKLVKEGLVRKVGAGRSTAYEWAANEQ